LIQTSPCNNSCSSLKTLDWVSHRCRSRIVELISILCIGFLRWILLFRNEYQADMTGPTQHVPKNMNLAVLLKSWLLLSSSRCCAMPSPDAQSRPCAQ
jgi:hypothetical protein